MAMYRVFYCEEFNDSALGNDENPLRKKLDFIVDDLKENRRTNLGDVKLIKGDGGVKYFRAKLSDTDRLLFSSIKYKGEDGFVLLEVILNHDYDKSKFLKNKSKIKFIKIVYNEDGKEVRDNVEITDAPKIHWFGKFITFGVKQEDIVENVGGMYKLPLVVIGHAGSGKTSVALEKLRKIEEEFEEGRILYITQSENLVKQSKELYEYEYWDEAAKKLRTGLPEQIDFLSIHAFLERVTKDVEGRKAIDRNIFFSWFEGRCNQAKFNDLKKDVEKVFEEFTAVIVGGGLGKEGGREEYMKLGKRQSIFSEEKRSNIYDLFEEYKKFVKGSSEYYDSSLVASEYFETMPNEKFKEAYDAVVIDEVQDLTRSMLTLILKSLKDNFLLCGDVNQVIHPSFFSASKLKDFLCKNIVNKGTELTICSLEKNYRNSQQVIDLANRILHLKNYCFASEDIMTEEEKLYFFMKSEKENLGYVGLIAEVEEMARKVSESTGYAILVLDNEYKQEAKESFETPLIFNIQEAKGLEFRNVILCKWDEAYKKLWNLVCPNKAKTENIIDEIRSSYNEGNINASRPKDKTDKSFEEYKFYVNALYVGVTRAIDNVYIVGDKRQLNLLKVVVPGEEVNIVDSASIEKKESTPEEWRDMALDLISKGNLEQAKGIAKKLLNREEYVREIIDALKAQKWNKEAEEIQVALTKSKQKTTSDQVTSSVESKAQSEQIMTTSLKSKTFKKNPSQQFSQKGSINDTKPKSSTEGAKKPKKKRAPKQNQKDSQTKELEQNQHLVDVICGDKIDEFENEDISLYNKQDMINLAFEKHSLKIADHLIKDFTPKMDKSFLKSGELYSVLFHATHGGNKNVVELLLDCGAGVNAKAEDDITYLHVAAQEGHKDIIELLLDRGAHVNSKDKEGLTPLYTAAQKDREDVVDLLLDRGANINASDKEDCNCTNTPIKGHTIVAKYTLLHMAIYKGHTNVAKILSSKGADVNVKTTRGTTPLHMAAFKGYTDVVDILLNKGANVDDRNNNGTTPLYMAAQGSHKDVAEHLVSKGADVNAKDKNQITLLHLAAEKGHTSVAEILLNYGADVNAKTKEGFTPLYMAVRERHKDVAELLLNHEADVNAEDKEGGILLHMAVQNDQKDIVKLLLDRGVDVDAKNEEGSTPFYIAVQKGLKDVAEILLNHGADTNTENMESGTILHVAAKYGHEDVVRLLLDRAADVSARDKEGFTPLHVAADEGCAGVAEILLAEGADVNVKAENSVTPLIAAASKGHKEVVEILLKNNADVTIVAKEGTPLQMAVQKGHDNIVDLLLNKGTNLNDEEGYNLLYMAALNGHKNVIDLLQRRGANINAKSKDGETLVIKVAQNSTSSKAIDLLLSCGANVNAKDADGFPILHVALLSSHLVFVSFLLNHGANINAKDSNGRTLLHIAALGEATDKTDYFASKGNGVNADVNANVTKYLLSEGADVNAKDKDGNTPFHLAAHYGFKDVATILLRHGANINAKTKQGSTPLHMAAQEGHLEMVKMLLSKGADVNAKTKQGTSPLYFAAVCGQKDVAELLVCRGANISSKDKKDVSLIHLAAREGRTNVLEILSTIGADINSVDQLNNKSLCMAARFGRRDIVEFLLDHGADVDAKDEDTTALHLAVLFGHKDVVEILLNRGADDGNETYVGLNALCLAADKGHIHLVDFLLDRRIKINAKDADGDTILHMVAANGHKKVAEILLDKGADINAKNNMGFTALCMAAQEGHKDFVEFLLDRIGDVNAKSCGAPDALFWAAENGYEDIVDIFLDRGLDINAKGEEGFTSLHLAAFRGHTNGIEICLGKGANVHAKDGRGCTPLHVAAIRGFRNVAEVFLNHGANVDARNDGGRTPLYFALERSHSNVVELLLERGADVTNT